MWEQRLAWTSESATQRVWLARLGRSGAAAIAARSGSSMEAAVPMWQYVRPALPVSMPATRTPLRRTQHSVVDTTIVCFRAATHFT